MIYGGAGAGKSHAVAQVLIQQSCQEIGVRTLVLRKVQKDIRYSVFALMRSIIEDADMARAYTVHTTDMWIRNRATGAEFIFLGLDDVARLKSIHGISQVWCEEASEMTERDIDQVNLRVRGPTPVARRIFLTFNPVNKEHWLKRRFFDRPDEARCHVMRSTYADNSFIDQDYERELEGLQAVDPQLYAVYCLGEWGELGDTYFHNFVIEPFSYGAGDLQNEASGMDFGYVHASAIIRCGWKDGDLYVYDEVSWRETTNRQMIDRVRAEQREVIVDGEPTLRPFISPADRIVADSAEPDRIREWRDAGYHVRPAKKRQGSLVAGIDYLAGKRIHIHPRCSQLAKWFPLYRRRVDPKTGEPLEQPIEEHDDEIAALRYAVEDVRMGTKIRIGAGVQLPV